MSAQRDLLPLDEIRPQMEAAPPVALKEQAAQRLAAHRARRGQPPADSIAPNSKPANPRVSRIAAAVAERYANSQTYRAFLAEQAEAAIRQAEAAAEVAALNAQAVTEVQTQLLAELDQWNLTPPTPPAPTPLAPRISEAKIPSSPASSSPNLTVKLYAEDQVALLHSELPVTPNHRRNQTTQDETEILALEEEIAFRQAPVFEDIGPPIDIPANLIEFPRQLIASRKARPRLAEGPLREEADQSAHQDTQTAQLRIFEVEPAQISTNPVVDPIAPEWSSILLSAQPVSTVVQQAPEATYQPIPAPQSAPFTLRLMAGIVDGCIITAAFLVFTAAFAMTVGKLSGASAPTQITPQAAAITTAVTLIVFTLLYQFLFFTFAEATPGMRYARIGLCTLDDNNPTRSAIRRRIFATVLAACPLGIGFLWAWFDDDGLGWHDRISRMYQRSY